MKPVTRAEILPNAEFVELRRKREREVIAGKDARRLAVGPNMTLLFENRESVWWQVQEMCRVEHITAEAAIAHELETYNHLLPGAAELSATLLVEYPEPAAVLVDHSAYVARAPIGGILRGALCEDLSST